MTLTLSKKEIMIPIADDRKQEKVNINEKVKVEDILNVLDVTTKVRKVNITKSGSYYNYEGEAVLNIYYEAGLRNGLNVKEATVPFVIRVENDENIEFEFNCYG